MIDLNETDTLLKIPNVASALQSVDEFPAQLKQAYREARAIPLPKEYKKASNILVCGMGGSRFPALIIKELFKDKLRAPLEIQDDYSPPAWAGKNTLIVLSSYSGTTEEVVYSEPVLRDRGCTLFTGVTSGGDLERILKEKNEPVYVFDPIHNPSGQPRIGVGYGVGGLLGLLVSAGFIETTDEEIDSAIAALSSLLASFRVSVNEEENPAKKLAQKIHNKYPYYIVSEFLRGTGNALANQTNETAKSISDFRIIPELNHHLMEGLKFPPEIKKLGLFVFFTSNLYSDRIKKRFDITREVVEQNTIETYQFPLHGANKIEQVFEFLGLGGYLTMYLSLLYEQDPNAIPFVDYFKKKLKE